MQIRFKTPPLLTNFLGLDLKLGELLRVGWSSVELTD
jgi:hypothetical protein